MITVGTSCSTGGSGIARTACVALCAFAVFLASGCAGFRLRPYDQLARDTERRTIELSGRAPELAWVNRSAQLPGRSQAEIKRRIGDTWEPSLRPATWLNYSGLLATRYSQLDTQPSEVFEPGSLTVRYLGSDTQVRYIAAIRPGRRLPLVVGVSGINGSVDGKITVETLQSLYDTGEFHVLHLESVTSVAHQVRNQQPFLGGYPEGLLLYQTLAALRDGVYADSIAQVHLLGVSYGGMLCGFAAHLEQTHQQGVIDGAVLALSPPMDLKTLFANLEVHAIIHDKVEKGYLREGIERFIHRANFGLDGATLDRLNFDSYMRRLAFPQFRRLKDTIRQETSDLPPIDSPDDLYALTSLHPHLATLGVPYMMIQSYDDPVVSPEDHFAAALAASPNPLLDGILLPDGGHLGFDTVTRSPFTARAAIEYFRYWSVPAAAHVD